MFSFVVYIKSLACLLITNSHFNRIWPISAMATGGAIGNALFFMVAGFCLSRVDGNFRSWYGKRLFRLYPQTWMVILITLLFNQEKPCDAIAYLRTFIFPTWYWFVGAIALYYAICFAIKKNRVNVKIVSKLCFPMSLLLAIGGIGISADIVYRVHHMVIRKVAK